MFELKTPDISTEDGLNLMGFHYDPGKRDVCVLLTHGMAGNFLENNFGQVLGEELSKSGIGYIYAHNRGYSLINDIVINERNEQGGFKTKRIGVAYERFEESVFDLDAWIKKTKELGYKKIILAGHSLGTNKVVHYVFKKQPDISGLILLSPPDMVSNAKENGKSKNYDLLNMEAVQNVSEGNFRKLLSKELWDWYFLSSQTFLDLMVDFCPADNLPLFRNPDTFPELAAVKAPILSVMGEFDDIVVRSLDEDQKLLELKATSAKSFTQKIIPKANHGYDNQAKVLAKEIIDWINKL